MHRHDPARRQALDDRRRLLRSGRRPAADRDEQQVDAADRRDLLVAQRALAEVAEVTDAQAVELEHEDRVRTAFGAGRLVVLGGDRGDLADRRLQLPGGRAQDRRVAADGLDAVVIDVLVGHQQQLRLQPLDRRVVELDPVTRRHADMSPNGSIATVVSGCAQTKGRLAVPLNLHAAPLCSGLG